MIHSPTLFIGLGTIRKEVFASEVDAVSVEVVRLKKPRPELLFRHLVRNVLVMLLSYYTQYTAVTVLSEYRWRLQMQLIKHKFSSSPPYRLPKN